MMSSWHPRSQKNAAQPHTKRERAVQITSGDRLARAHHPTCVDILHLFMNQASTRASRLTGEKGVGIAASYGLGIGRGEPSPESPICMGAIGDAAAGRGATCSSGGGAKCGGAPFEVPGPIFRLIVPFVPVRASRLAALCSAQKMSAKSTCRRRSRSCRACLA